MMDDLRAAINALAGRFDGLFRLLIEHDERLSKLEHASDGNDAVHDSLREKDAKLERRVTALESRFLPRQPYQAPERPTHDGYRWVGGLFNMWAPLHDQPDEEDTP